MIRIAAPAEGVHFRQDPAAFLADPQAKPVDVKTASSSTCEGADPILLVVRHDVVAIVGQYGNLHLEWDAIEAALAEKFTF